MDLDRRPSGTFYFNLHDEHFNDTFGFFGHSIYMNIYEAVSIFNSNANKHDY